ncbi:MAG TPA: hypothetical protein VFU47_11965 [Armatimonadota bacterium]|nr:hypothetical protein [Armatimonadota bacterium]
MHAVPSEEVRTLLDHVDRAVRLARAGAYAEGHAELLAGLQRAQRLRRHGREWAAVLVTRYRIAVDSYCDRYGVPLS